MTTSGTIEPLYRSSDDHLLRMRGRCGIKERFACIVDLALPNWPPRDLGVVARVQVDVLIAGSDALLMTVAAHTALRRGLGVLLAPEASHLDVSSLAAETPQFRAWFERRFPESASAAKIVAPAGTVLARESTRAWLGAVIGTLLRGHRGLYRIPASSSLRSAGHPAARHFVLAPSLERTSTTLDFVPQLAWRPRGPYAALGIEAAAVALSSPVAFLAPPEALGETLSWGGEAIAFSTARSRGIAPESVVTTHLQDVEQLAQGGWLSR